MSTFDHESEDQSEACNQLIRDFDLAKPESFDEEHDRAIRHDIQAVREMREQKDSIGE